MTALCNNSEDESHWRFPPAHSNLIHGCPQVILPARRRRQRRRQGNPRWMRLCRCTGGTVMRRCMPAATSTQAAESTCWSLTTPIHSGAPRASTTESTTPDKPEYRHGGSQGVCMFMYVCVWVGGDFCDGSLYVCARVHVREKVIPDLFWTKPPEGDKETHLEPDFGDWTNMYVLYVYACPEIHPCYSLSSSPWKRSAYSRCIFTACPCCAHIDQAVGLCSHIVFHHFSPRAPLLSPPQPDTVQRGLVAVSALSDAFFVNGNPGESRTPASQLFPVTVGGNRWLLIPQRTQRWKSNDLANVLHDTMFSVTNTHTHIKNTSAHKVNHPFFGCESVVCDCLQ